MQGCQGFTKWFSSGCYGVPGDFKVAGMLDEVVIMVILGGC